MSEAQENVVELLRWYDIEIWHPSLPNSRTLIQTGAVSAEAARARIIKNYGLDMGVFTVEVRQTRW